MSAKPWRKRRRRAHLLAVGRVLPPPPPRRIYRLDACTVEFHGVCFTFARDPS